MLDQELINTSDESLKEKGKKVESRRSHFVDVKLIRAERKEKNRGFSIF